MVTGAFFLNGVSFNEEKPCSIMPLAFDSGFKNLEFVKSSTCVNEVVFKIHDMALLEDCLATTALYPHRLFQQACKRCSLSVG